MKTVLQELISELEEMQKTCKTVHEIVFFDAVLSIIESEYIEKEKKQIEELEKKLPRWIQVKEWNEEFTVCIFRSKDGKRFVGHLETIEGKQAICTDLGYALESDLGVTHCMPLHSLPEPPK